MTNREKDALVVLNHNGAMGEPSDAAAVIEDLGGVLTVDELDGSLTCSRDIP